jgi:hypothetical protein
VWGSIRRPGRLSQPGSFFPNSSSWCSGLGCRETRAAASSTALIRSVVSFSCKEGSVKNIIQVECTLALTISDSSCLFPPSPPPLISGSKGRCEHCLRIRVIVCL